MKANYSRIDSTLTMILKSVLKLTRSQLTSLFLLHYI